MSQESESYRESTQESSDSPFMYHEMDELLLKDEDNKMLILEKHPNEWPEKESKREEFHEIILSSHNQYRALHGAPPLSLNQDMSAYALEFAKILSEDLHYMKKDIQQRNDEQYGENVYRILGKKMLAREPVDSWYNEISAFDYANPSITDTNKHFTALVWKSSKEIGIGIAKCGLATAVVCNYFPRGNLSQSLKENVLQKFTIFDPENSFNLAKFQNDALLSVNKLRQLHGVPPLLIRKEFSQMAQQWAETYLISPNDTMDYLPTMTYGHILSIYPASVDKMSLAETFIYDAYRTKEFFDFETGQFSHTKEEDNPKKALLLLWGKNYDFGIGLASDHSKHVIVAFFDDNLSGVLQQYVFPSVAAHHELSERPFGSAIVKKINYFRKLHGAPVLEENKMLAEEANNWAQLLLFNEAKVPVPQANAYSQEITLYGKDAPVPELHIETIYNYIADYNFVTHRAKGKSMKATRMIWGSTREVGVGLAKSDETVIVVIFYGPAGNLKSFKENVLRKPLPVSKKIFEEEVLMYINKYRLDSGVSQIQLNPELSQIAEKSAQMLLETSSKDFREIKSTEYFLEAMKWKGRIPDAKTYVDELNQRAKTKMNTGESQKATTMLSPNTAECGIGYFENTLKSKTAAVAIFFPKIGEPQATAEGESTLNKELSLQAFKREVLTLINEKRSKHGSPPLELDPQLNEIGKKYAEKQMKDGPIETLEEKYQKYGFRAHISTGARPTAKQFVEECYNSIEDYNFYYAQGPATAMAAAEMLWKQTRQMGIGYAENLHDSKAIIVTVFYPRGLKPSEFHRNVFPRGTIYIPDRPFDLIQFTEDLRIRINRHRNQHGSPPLHINFALSKIAEEVAQILVAVPKNEMLRTAYKEYGVLTKFCENCDALSAFELADEFYETIKNYDFHTGESKGKSLNATQLLWYDTNELAVGHARRGVFRVIALIFSPRGNNGWFKDNVFEAGTRYVERPSYSEVQIWPSSGDEAMELRRQILDRHNIYRERHGVQHLRLNEKMCETALDWAMHLGNDHLFEHSNNTEYGENLFSVDLRPTTANEVVDMWYNEITKYDFSNPEDTEVTTGHFTAIVWKNTTDIGIAVVRINYRVIVVCNYYVKGNIPGEFAENVLPEEVVEAKLIFQEETLKRVNEYRGMHGVAPIMISKDLVEYAEEWAKFLTNKGTKSSPEEDDRYNLILHFADSKLDFDFLDAYYQNIKYYDFFTGTIINSKANEALLLIWKHTEAMGVSYDFDKETQKYVIVVAFSPAIKNLNAAKESFFPKNTAFVAKDNSVIDKLKNRILNQINIYRKLHGAPSIKLSVKLTFVAQTFAQLRSKNPRDIPRDIDDPEFGCSIVLQFRPIETKELVDQLYGKIKYYNFTTGELSNPEALHALNLIWKRTEELGIGYAMNEELQCWLVVLLFHPKVIPTESTNNVLPAGTVIVDEQLAKRREFINSVIRLINEYRKKHNVDLLKQSLHLTNLAQEAAELRARNSSDIPEELDNQEYGRVLFLQFRAIVAEEFVDHLYRKIKYYDFSSGKLINPEAMNALYLIWKHTNELGIGHAMNAESGFWIVVLLFHPKAIETESKLNVFPVGTVLSDELFNKEEFNSSATRLINEYRKMHGVAPLKQSLRLTNLAEEAAQLKAEYPNEIHEDEKSSEYSIILFFEESEPPSPVKLVKDLYNTLQFYDFNSHQYSDPKALQGLALIWKNTKELGIGYGTNTLKNRKAVAIYLFPKGLQLGTFRDNVFAKSDHVEMEKPIDRNAFQLGVLKYHNNFRRLHGAPDLVVNNKLASLAQKRAQELVARTPPEALEMVGSPYGQDISIFKRKNIEAEEYVNRLYKNLRAYNFHADAVDGYQLKATQLLWRSTKEIGTGIAENSQNYTVIVTFYNPKGNLRGYFTENVLPLGTVYVPDKPFDKLLYENAVLARINYHRKNHGAPPLKFSVNASDAAQEFAQKLIEKSTAHKFRPQPSLPFYQTGRIIFGRLPTAEEFVDSEYCHIDSHDFSRPSNEREASNATQMLWRSTQEIGVGYAAKDNRKIIVVFYYPKGNMKDQMSFNVLPYGTRYEPVKPSEDERKFADAKFRQKVLERHNELRALHQVPPLNLSPSLNIEAQALAQELADDPRRIDDQRDISKEYGRNIYGCGSCDPESTTEFVDLWYECIEYYDFATVNYRPEALRATQMIWKRTKEIGVGLAKGRTKSFVVVFYNPKGNIKGEFNRNVLIALSDHLSEEMRRSSPWNRIENSKTGSYRSTECLDNCTESQVIKNVLIAHNKYRRIYGVPPVSISSELSEDAMNWAKMCLRKGFLERSPRNDVGQNIIKDHAKVTGTDIVQKWYAQASMYDFMLADYVSEAAGFTQLVWKNTDKLGVGFVRSDAEAILVIFYYPKGNIKGKFKHNVPPIAITKSSRGRERSKEKTKITHTESKDSEGSESLIRNPVSATKRHIDPTDANIVLREKRRIQSLEMVLKIDGSVEGIELLQFQNAFLFLHNKYRTLHGSPPLTMSEKLIESATEWAEIIAQEGKLRTRPHSSYGENLYTFSNKKNAIQVVKAWYDQRHDYNFLAPGFYQTTGGFTQIVWRKTRLVGVGLAKNDKNVTFLVANYAPAGNRRGQFRENVLPRLGQEVPQNLYALKEVEPEPKDEEYKKWQQTFLELINICRAKHSAGKLVICDELSATAWDMANYLLNNGPAPPSHKNYGKTLFESTKPAIIPKEVIDGWYAEITGYNFQKPEPEQGRAKYFTQMVWKGSLQVGIAKLKKGATTLVIALFFPPGNVTGQYQENVLPLSEDPSYVQSVFVQLRNTAQYYWNR